MKRLPHFGVVIDVLGPGSTVVLHSGCAEPAWLGACLAEHAVALTGTRVINLMSMGELPYCQPQPSSCLDIATLFPGKGVRAALAAGKARTLRMPMSGICVRFDSGEIKANVLLLQVSPPDANGQVSLGVSVDYMHAVLRQSPMVVAEINPRMPRTRGDSLLPIAAIDWYVDSDAPLPEINSPPADPLEARIARTVAALVGDGAVLQMGSGALPTCVFAQLGHLQHLGLHTGLVSDSAIGLIESGVIDNSTKTCMPGLSVATMAGGTRRLYDFLDSNGALELHPCSLTHDARVLAGIDGLCAINSALQVDLAGNVNAEVINGRRIALPGGLPDFAQGASSARGGVSIIAIRSESLEHNVGNIVSSLPTGAPVTVPAGMVDFIVTEYGAARIRGLAAGDRARSLIGIAHPARREELRREIRHW